MTNENVFDMLHRPEELLVKEFSGEGKLDDHEAFVETQITEFPESVIPGLESLPNWRPAKSILKLHEQINTAYPHRSTASDGIIGNATHCPGSSDHCPNIKDGGIGVVTAIDITHDPASGCDMQEITRSISGDKDRRIKYIIHNGQICSSYPHGGKPAWAWRPYLGSNPHTKHAHFSVGKEKARYDDAGNWKLTANGNLSTGV